MTREYHRWYSPALGREMELLVFGHGGTPMVVFPTSKGRFWDYEERGMIHAVGGEYEAGRLQAFCVDSVDAESWYNLGIDPAQRARRHNQYEAYLLEEVLPFVRSRNPGERVGLTGCSFGGYHTINFALKHPERASFAVSMGGAFDIKPFVDGYFDDNVYFNSPIDFLPGLSDPRYLEEYRGRVRLVLATGETDICLEGNKRLSAIMSERGIPHWLDVWGNGTGHDWPWWQQMARKYFT